MNFTFAFYAGLMGYYKPIYAAILSAYIHVTDVFISICLKLYIQPASLSLIFWGSLLDS